MLTEGDGGHTLTNAALRAHGFVAETQRLRVAGGDKVFAESVSKQGRDDAVAIGQLHVLQAVQMHRFVFAERRFLDLAQFAEDGEVAILVVRFYGQDGHNFFARSQREQLARRFALCWARSRRDVVCGNLEDAARVADTEDVILRGGGDDLLELLVAARYCVGSIAILALWRVGVGRQSFERAGTSEDDHQRLAFVQALHRLDGRVSLSVGVDGGAPLVAKLFDKLLHLFFEQGDQRLAVAQQPLQFADTREQVFFLPCILPGVQLRHLSKRHGGDNLGLDGRELVERLDLFASGGTILGLLEDFDDAVGVGRADDEALDDVQAFAGLAQLKLRAARQHVDLVRVPVVEQVEHAGLARLTRGLHGFAKQEDHLEGERDLQVGFAEQLRKHLCGIGILAQFQHDAHALLGIAFVAQVGHQSFELARVDGLDDRSFDLVAANRRDLRDDQRAAARRLFQAHLGAHDDTSLARRKVVLDALVADDATALTEIGAGDVGHELLDAHLRIVQQGDAGAHDLAQIVRRDVGRKTDCDAAGRVDDGRAASGQVVRLQHLRFLLVGLVQGDSFALHIGHHRRSQGREAHFGVAIGSRSIAVLAAHVTLPLDQGIAHSEGLGHAHGSVVDRGIAVRVIVAQNKANYLGALDRRTAGKIAGLAHPGQDTALHRLQAIASIGQRAVGDNGEAIGGEGVRHDNGKIFFANAAVIVIIVIQLCGQCVAISWHTLYIQFFDLTRMFGQEAAASFRVLIFHQLRDQLCRQHAIFHRDALEDAAGGVKGGVAQFFRVHLTQSFEAFEFQPLSVGVRGDELLPRLVIEQPDDLAFVFDRIERRAGDIDMAALDQVAELLVEERQQETLDVQPIHVGIGGDDDAMELQTADVEAVARPRAKHIDNRAYLLVFYDAFQVGLCHIERLAFELEYRLKLGETSLTGAPTGAVALDDEQFSARWIAGVAAQEFFRQRGIDQFAVLFIACARQFLNQLGLVARLLHLQDFLQPLFARPWIALKPLLQSLVNHRTHNAFDRSVIQPVFGLPLKLRTGQFHRDGHVQPLLDHLGLEAVLLAAFDNAEFERVVIDNFRQRGLETGLMHPAVTGAHGVGKAVHGDLIAGSRLQGHFDLHAILLFRNADHVLEQGRAGTRRQVPYIIGEALTRVKIALDRRAGIFVVSFKVEADAAIEIGGSLAAADDGIQRVPGISIENRTVVEPAQLRAMQRGIARRNRVRHGNPPAERLAELLPILPDGQFQPF